MFKHILIPTDGSPLSERAAQGAVQLAKSLAARVTAINISAPYWVFHLNPAKATVSEETYRSDCEKKAAVHLAVVRQASEKAGVDYDEIHAFAEHPYAAIVEAAQENECDAICMASHGHKGLAAVFLGSETVQVLTHSAIPVVVWR